MHENKSVIGCQTIGIYIKKFKSNMCMLKNHKVTNFKKIVSPSQLRNVPASYIVKLGDKKVKL